MHVRPKLTAKDSTAAKLPTHGRQRHDPQEFPANGVSAKKKVSTSVKKAKEEGQPFIVAWRLYPDVKHPRWQVGDDAGCGCGPID
jgi:hypothetical protein